MGPWSWQACTLRRRLSTWSDHSGVDPAEVPFACKLLAWGEGVGRWAGQEEGVSCFWEFSGFPWIFPGLELKGGRRWGQERRGPVASRRPEWLPSPAEPRAPRAGEV